MLLSPQQQQDVCQYVAQVLQTSMARKIAAAELPITRGGDAAVALTAAMRAAVNEGIAIFLETQNEDPACPVTRVPPELFSACFRRLNFRDRVSVSHVSRRWRRVALADHSLWNTVILRASRPCTRAMLETLLDRSGRMPFDFTWDSLVGNMPGGLLDVLLPHMDRMVVFNLHSTTRGANDRVLQQRAPSLRSLISEDSAIAVLPADWGPRWVPRLETLQLDSFSIPDDFQPLSTLTSFHGRLAEGSSYPRLSLIFPSTVQLDLQGITHDALQMLGPPPLSCREVWLRSAERNNYASYLRACYDHRIPFLHISGILSIIPSVREFVHSTQGEYRMIASYNHLLRLECDEDAIIREVVPFRTSPILDELHCFTLLDRLCEISLPLPLLLGMHNLQSLAVTSFPSLRSLTILLPMGRLPSLGGLADVPFQMPALETLTLDAGDIYYVQYTEDAQDMGHFTIPDPDGGCADVPWIISEFPRAFPALLQTGRPRLSIVAVILNGEEDAADFSSEHNLSAFRGVAQTFYICDQSRSFCHVEEFAS